MRHRRNQELQVNEGVGIAAASSSKTFLAKLIRFRQFSWIWATFRKIEAKFGQK